MGDSLMSSDVKGCAEKQEDDLYHNYTVAKAMEPVHGKPGKTTRLLACRSLGG